MQLSLKLIGTAVLVILLLVAADGYLSYKRQTEVFSADMKKDARLLGHSIAGLASGVYVTGGESRAQRLVDDVNRSESEMHARWVWADAAAGDRFSPRVAGISASLLDRINDTSVVCSSGTASGFVCTYVPIELGSARRAYVEMSEPLRELRSYTWETARRSITLAITLVAAGLLIMWFVGAIYIAHPITQLVDKTRRISEGDLGSDLHLRGHDELTDLATAMNDMCAKLAAAADTIRRETERRIAALEQLRHSERLATLGRISSGIAHELGTPINVILGRAKIVANEGLTKDELVENARVISSQSDRMARIIRQFLDFARRPQVQRSASDMRAVIDQTVSLLSPIARKSNVTFSVLVDQTLRVTADQSQMQQVLANIILNAIQAMPQGGRITIATQREQARHPTKDGAQPGEYLAVSVADRGIGIPGEDLVRIFEPFFTTKETGKGTGLGLSIVQDIVDEHNGWVAVQSTAGLGACFTVYLPVGDDA